MCGLEIVKMPYHEIIYDSGYTNEQTIEDYRTETEDVDITLPWKEIPNYKEKIFDITLFWQGKKFRGKIPEFVKLYIREGDENLPKASLLANPISWLIFSQRLLDFWWLLIKDDVQVFDAPVYLKSGQKVEGYKIINPIRVIDCLDIEKSHVDWNEDGTISFANNIYIKEDKVGNHHIFRLKGYKYCVIVSDKLAKSLKGNNFKGIAFIRLGTSSTNTNVKAVK